MEHGGNYTAALLVAVGCEALSLLLEQTPSKGCPFGLQFHRR